MGTRPPILLAPSILSADFARLGEQVAEAEAAGADRIHIDVMDGHFVPVISLGIPIVEAVRRVTRLPLDIHLMVSEPERQVDAFMEAGGDILNVHTEACTHLHRVIRRVRERGKQVGVCLNPATPLSAVEEVLEEVDQITVMTVNPGYAGQSFIPSVLGKVRRLRRLLDERGLSPHIVIDGGVNPETAPLCVSAGATVLVAASAVFNRRAPVAENLARLRASLEAL